MIRRKKSRIYRVKDSTCTVSEFRKSLSVSVNEVTEYSRPTKHASTFSKVFTRCEVVVKAGLYYLEQQGVAGTVVEGYLGVRVCFRLSHVRLEVYKDVLMSDIQYYKSKI